MAGKKQIEQAGEHQGAIEAGHVISAIDALLERRAFLIAQAEEIDRQVTAIRDRLNGRARKARSGKFTRKRKSAAADVEPTPLDHARREVVGDV